MYRDYRDKDVNFYYVYSNIQHPEINNFVQPYNLQERLLHIAEIRKRSGSQMPWLADSMEHALKTALGAAPNGEYVFDPAGKLIRKRFWSDPDTLRADLAELVGKSDRLTRVEDLQTVFKVESRDVASGVVQPVRLPARMMPLQSQPVVPGENSKAQDGSAQQPYYVKLRAEIEQRALRAGSGKLYLGFYLDPLYQVHWNNDSGQVRATIETETMLAPEDRKLDGPEVEVSADIDPRQFLIDVSNIKAGQKFRVRFDYVVCDDAESFCLPIVQYFEVSLERDRFGGSRPGVFMPQMFADVKKFDANGDGEITQDELPTGQVSLYIGHLDKNNDKKLDSQEIEDFLKMFNNGRGFDRNSNDGGQP